MEVDSREPAVDAKKIDYDAVVAANTDSGTYICSVEYGSYGTKLSDGYELFVRDQTPSDTAVKMIANAALTLACTSTKLERTSTKWMTDSAEVQTKYSGTSTESADSGDYDITTTLSVDVDTLEASAIFTCTTAYAKGTSALYTAFAITVYGK